MSARSIPPREFDSRVAAGARLVKVIDADTRRRLHRLGVISDREKPTERDVERSVSYLGLEPITGSKPALAIVDFESSRHGGPDAINAAIESIPAAIVDELLQRSAVAAWNARTLLGKSLAVAGRRFELAPRGSELAEELNRKIAEAVLNASAAFFDALQTIGKLALSGGAGPAIAAAWSEMVTQLGEMRERGTDGE